MAQRAALGDAAELRRLNDWVADWIAANPAYLGANWKCGQEASIRVMHLTLAALILDQAGSPTPGLIALLRMHLRRISPTIGYAVGQQNNHGTSEAAALFIGGSWLEQLGDREGRRWHRAGRRWLEDRARVLIAHDGTFSQYSVNYHRLMLSTYSLTEAWRRRYRLAPFSTRLMKRLRAATAWLHQVTDPETGDAPNLGANDGANLIVLTDADFRDYRPALQLAAALFLDRTVYGVEQDQALIWLGVSRPDKEIDPPRSLSFDTGGLHVLRSDAAVAYLRYPRFRFRPSQSDALHLDLWVRGENLLRDAGTYSYNVSTEDTAYFNGVESHNTIQIDGREQMPRISRFLFGAWLRAEAVETVGSVEGQLHAAAGYRDSSGGRHHRRVYLDDQHLLCEDTVRGAVKRCVLRWRLRPGKWRIIGDTVTDGTISIQVSSSPTLSSLKIVEGSESRYYLRKTALPVLEAEMLGSGTFTTRITF